MRRLSFALIALTSALLAGCASQTPPQATALTAVTYAVPLTIAAAPAYVAADQDYWGELGLKVELEMYNSGREALDVLLAGSAQVMSVSETPPLRAAMGGQDIRWIATVADHNEAKLTVRADRISDDFDLSGHRIGTVAGTNSDYYLSRWLDANDLTTQDLEIVALDPPSLVQAFIQGDIDAMFAWEPHNYNAYSELGANAMSAPTELYEGRHSIIVNANFPQSHPGEARLLLQGLQRAEVFISEHPAEARAIVSEATGMDEDVLEQLWTEYEFRIGLDAGLLTILQDEAEWIAASEGGTVPELISFIDPSSLRAVDPGLVDSNY